VRIIDAELIAERPAEALWRVWSDVAQWSERDPHEEEARLDGPFARGTQGSSRPRGALAGAFEPADVGPPTRWVSRSTLPLGALAFSHTIEKLDATRCRFRLIADATGPMAVVV
jgi:hypothetical protein